MADHIGIISIGHYLPEKKIENSYFSEKLGLDTSSEWIASRSGIQTRRVKADSEKTSDLAVNAANDALKQSPVSLADIDFIICATATPDYVGFPSTACLVQKKLNIKRAIPCVDISAACSGFTYALSLGYSKIFSGLGRYGLIIAAESLSDVLDWSDRRTSILFGDGAGAAIIGPVKQGGFKWFNEGADGTFSDILTCEPKKGTRSFQQTKDTSLRHVIHMDGSAVYKQGVKCLDDCLTKLEESSGYALKDIDYVVPHQANLRMIEAVSSRFDISLQRFLTNISTVGNTSAASIPIVLSENKNIFKSGDLLCLIGFGAGFTWSSIVLEWGT